MNQIPLVTIAFVFRERFSSTVSCLIHLLENTPQPYELICVDAGSPLSISSILRDLASQNGFTLIRSEDYLTPNESRNLALAHVNTQYVIFVDNDVKVGKNWLEPLVRCADDTGAWLVAPLYMQSFRGELKVHMFGGVIRVCDIEGRPAYSEKHQLQFDTLSNGTQLMRQTTDLIEFHTVLMNMDAYHMLGPFDEKLFNCSEHADLSLAVKNANKQIYLEPTSVITYQIPDRLEAIDMDFFALRWSEAWTQATLERLTEKYSIPSEDIGLMRIGIWVRKHRQKALVEYPVIRKIFGETLHKKFRNWIGQRLESWRNLRQYPVSEYVTDRRVSTRIISTQR